jgi:hypothetical protein
LQTRMRQQSGLYRNARAGLNRVDEQLGNG